MSSACMSERATYVYPAICSSSEQGQNSNRALIFANEDIEGLLVCSITVDSDPFRSGKISMQRLEVLSCYYKDVTAHLCWYGGKRFSMYIHYKIYCTLPFFM